MVRRLVVIGASAGGIEALRTLVGALPADFGAPIAIVLHTSGDSPGVLDGILTRSGPLAALRARHKQLLQPSHIYVAPPDHHLLVEPGRLRVTRGPRENGFRPAIDPLFRSAAQVFGPAAIGVILTGQLDDGTAGLWAIKRLGGTTVVQDPADALFPSMPESALAHVAVDHCVPLASIAPLLARLVTSPIEPGLPAPAPADMDIEVKIANEEDPRKAGIEQLGSSSTFVCPECHGALLQIQEGGRIRFRCHTGHAFSADSLMAAVDESIEEALWHALRTVHEGAMLAHQIRAHMATAHPGTSGARLAERAQVLERQVELLRTLLTSSQPAQAEP